MTLTSALSTLCLLLGFLPEADDPPPPPTPPQEQQAKQDSKPGKEPAVRSIPLIDQDLLKSLEKNAAPDQLTNEHPLLRVGERMRDVQGRLVKADSGEETQTIQNGIVEDLDKLIEELKKAGAKQKNQSQKQQQQRQTSNEQAKQQGKPNQASEPKEGQVTARPGDVHDGQLAGNTRLVRAVWGHLPDKLKEEMQQAFQDTGLPKYRPLIEQYFRAIAEQNEPRR